MNSHSSLLESKKAAERIAPYTLRTPLIFSHEISAKVGRPVYLKLENLQVTGSFKARPAFNGILSHFDQAKAHGVITSSSGNFAQAVAYAGKTLGVKTTIVMMSDASAYKRNRTLAYGAEVVECGDTYESRAETVEKLKKSRPDALEVHPHDSEDTILGDSTCGLEIHEDLSGPFILFCPCSGGGLVTGLASVLKTLDKRRSIYAAQPEKNGSMAQSMTEGKRVNVGKVLTLADALIASTPGEKTFALAQKWLNGCSLVSEDAIQSATTLLLEEHKLVVEPGGAAAVAVILDPRTDLKGDPTVPVVCVVTGGNVEPGSL